MDITPIIVTTLILFALAVFLVIMEKLLGGKKDKNITINKDKVIAVSGEGTLLGFLSDNRIYIPSACGGKATCGHCKVKVLSGAGSILPTEEPYMSPQEKAEGTRLACQVKVREDIEIYLPEDLLAVQEYNAVVEEVSDLTHDIKYVKLKLVSPEEIFFKPGQYVQIKVPGIDIFRAYSVASNPNRPEEIEFTIRQVYKGMCSTYIHKVLTLGEMVTFTGPYGDFYLQKDSDREIICIAGGCGMAPIRSILHYLCEDGMKRKVTYFFGARSKKDLFYTGELMEMQKQYPSFRYVPALSEPAPQDHWDGETGLITHVMDRYIDHADSSEAYLCGPPPMIDAAVKILKNKGMDESFIFFDKF